MLGPYSNQLVEWSWTKYRRDQTDNKQNAQIWEVGEEAKWKWNERLRSNYSSCAKRMGQLIIGKPAGTMGQPPRRETEGICEQAKQGRGGFIEKSFSKLGLLACLPPWRPASLTVTSLLSALCWWPAWKEHWDSRALTQGADLAWEDASHQL